MKATSWKCVAKNKSIAKVIFHLQTILHNLWLGLDIKSAIDAERIHHQLMPMRVDFEEGFSKVKVISKLHLELLCIVL